ncbi:MAG TPA: carbamoyltransferase HypF [Candidatus Margulisbacteria bacterium]|nr:MAG: carbamoyltransferase HypF [Candidatus Margulisbacteria bacterium GWD2_39_127]HAR62319.1 carbamoyltransferase HypF [Candidatus Margulisiibacteriota bacterium]
MSRIAYNIEISGIVQGVGFRPFIYRLANSLGIAGYVGNSSKGVFILAESEPEILTIFLDKVQNEKPAIAFIDSLEVQSTSSSGYKEFSIINSKTDNENKMYISPDLSTCKDCRDDLLNEQNRRYRYPFTTCTYCGPRYSIIEHIPYDRVNTTMKSFPMCPLCQAEYDTPSDRRYHSQPNACPVCGPVLALYNSAQGRIENVVDPIGVAIQQLAFEKIVAIKGLGGYQLCCDARSHDAVKNLRERKYREDKPFAIMCKDIGTVTRYCYISEAEMLLLSSAQNPIVLLQRRESADIASNVSVDNNSLGVMLPYTPVHLLLMEQIPVLVMTSANISEQPIIKDDAVALEGLASIADYILVHNREISSRIDDSVFKVINEKPQAIRRGRGYVPGIIKHKGLKKTILAVGAELKNTFAINRGDTIFVGPHIGDLKNIETFRFFKESILDYQRKFGLVPDILACDKHPQYLSSEWAKGKELPVIGIQHHHAHLVSTMAENGIDGQVIGIAMDGTGYGDDGAIWGCESGIVSYSKFERKSHLDYFRLPGGDKCSDEVYRTALSLIVNSLGACDLRRFDFLRDIKQETLTILTQMIEKRVNSPDTSSMGRLFDGVSALLGLGNHARYEAGAAIILESIADKSVVDDYPVEIICKDNYYIWDWQNIIRSILEEEAKGIPSSILSAKFHNTVVRYILKISDILRTETGLDRVVLSGGVFLNSLISSKSEEALTRKGFKVYLQRILPPGDGGLALGQLIIANEVM